MKWMMEISEKIFQLIILGWIGYTIFKLRSFEKMGKSIAKSIQKKRRLTKLDEYFLSQKFFVTIYFVIVFSVISILTLSCERRVQENVNGCISCYEFANKASKEKVNIFMNTYIVPRGVREDGSPKISVIQIKTHSDTTFTFPIGEKILLVDNLSKEHRSSILEYARLNGYNEWDSAYNFILDYTKEISNLYYKLKILEVHSFPHLGEFVEFQISKQDKLVYCPDTSRVFSNTWKDFFEKAKKYGDNFYYKKVLKN